MSTPTPTYAAFVAAAGRPVTMDSPDQGVVDAVLTKCTRLPSTPGTEAFSLTFVASHEVAAQGTYTVTGNRIGSVPIFLVPAVAGPDGVEYLATFTQLVHETEATHV